MKTYYEMLSVLPTASSDDIKKAFRREIARYHPDKVQHLGREFQEMAAGIAASLTEAYRILMDPALRAKYDEELKGERDLAGLRTTTPVPSAHAAKAAPKGSAPPPHAPDSSAQASRAASFDFVRRATLSRVKHAIDAVSDASSRPASGFDLAYVIKPKKGLFKKSEPGVRLLVKIVPRVEAESIAECWPLALKAIVPDTTPTLMLIGPTIAPTHDLSVAVTEQRRRARGAGPLLVPVDMRDWEALFPPETPEAVRAIVKQLHADG